MDRRVVSGDLAEVLFQEAGAGLCLVAPDGTVLRANMEWLRSTGFALEDVLGKSIIDLFPYTRDLACDLHARVRAGERVDVPRHAQRIAGRVTWWEGSISPVRMEHGTGLLISAREVTAQTDGEKATDEAIRQSEARLREAFASETVGVLFFTLDGALLDANEAFLRMSGYSLDELRAITHWRTLTAADFWQATERSARNLAEKGETPPYEKVMLRKDGSRWWGLFAPRRVKGGGSDFECIEFIIDITERKRAEEERRLSEEQAKARAAELQAVLDAVPAAVIIAHDRDAHVMEVNKLGAALLRVPEGSNVAKTGAAAKQNAHFRCMHKGVEIAPEELPVRVAARQNKEIRDYELDLVFDDGETRRLIGNATPLRDSEGNACGAVAAFVDITARHRVVAEAMHLAELLDLGDAFFELDRDWRIVRVNANQEKLSRLPRSETLGRVFWEVWPETAAEDLQYWREYHRCMEQRIPVQFDEYFAPLDLWTGVTAYPSSNGGIAVFFRDVSRRRRAEAALQAKTRQVESLLTSAPLGLAFFDRDHRYVQINEVLAEINGIPVAHHIGRRIEELLPVNARAVAPVLDHIFATGETVANFEVTGETPREPGVQRHWLTGFYPVIDGEGRVELVGAWAAETTAMKRAERELREADHRKDEFLAVLAHELRNPLAPVRTGLQVMRLAGADEARRLQLVTMMERQVGHMVRLVDELLDISRIARGKIELKRECIELERVLQAGVETSRPLIDEMEHRFSAMMPVEPVLVDADPVRLAQVFSNLLNNAAKFTKRGGRIELRAEREGGVVCVSVKDNGIGIPREKLSTIFDMSSQLGGETAVASAGLGIGLSLVKRLLALHGGSVEALSEGPGRGAEFIVRLPIAVTGSGVAGKNGATVAKAAEGLRVLVVDDNVDAAESLVMLLEIMRNEVRTAHFGAEAVQSAAELRPHVVLLDIGLPDMSGYEVCRSLRAQPWGAGLTIIAVTGHGQEEHQHKAADAGFDHHLTKPVNPQALIRLLSGIKAVR